MWEYVKFLEFPADVTRKDPDLAALIVTQFGGPDGELSASLRYLSQMYTMPIPEAKATLNNIGTEELAHFEIIGTLVYKLVSGVPADVRSEEHTSELQSRPHLVCRLLLEKKKNT